MVDYVIGVSHKRDDPARVESLKQVPRNFVEDTPGPHWVWAPKMWRRALEWETSHCIFLQDDIIVHAPEFQRYCINEIVCLHTPHPKFKAVFDKGYCWARSVDGMVGNGYIFPSRILKEFLDFRENDFYPEVLTGLNEDAQIALFAMATGRNIWHPLPSPIDHDTSLPSTWGADHHPHRRPCVPWNSKRGSSERHPGEAPSVGRIYPAEHWRLLTHIRPGIPGLTERAYELNRY